MFTLDDILEATRGELLQKSETFFTGVSTDTRTLKPGDLLVALRGERSDGHQFLKEAVAKKTSALIIARDFEGEILPSVTVFAVHDTLQALGDLAHFWRERHTARVIAVSGSNGKTTTKELIAALLSHHSPTLKSEGNYNNLIGLPWTLFRLAPHHRFAVLELGINQPGEMERLAQIASPDIAVLTHIHTAHLEGLGSLEEVAQEKGRLLEGIEDGIAVLNRDDPFLRKLSENFGGKIIWYGLQEGADVVGKGHKICGVGKGEFHLIAEGKKIEVTLPLVGEHNLYNLAAAAAAGLSCGIDLQSMPEALKDFQPPPMRSRLLELPGEIFLVDDSYNGNPGSMSAALHLLGEQPVQGRRIAVLGDMLELGEFSLKAHEDLGMELANSKVDLIYYYGKHVDDVEKGLRQSGNFYGEFHPIQNKEESAQQILTVLRPKDWVLVKGSRGMRMEEMVQYLLRSLKGIHAVSFSI